MLVRDVHRSDRICNSSSVLFGSTQWSPPSCMCLEYCHRDESSESDQTQLSTFDSTEEQFSSFQIRSELLAPITMGKPPCKRKLILSTSIWDLCNSFPDYPNLMAIGDRLFNQDGFPNEPFWSSLLEPGCRWMLTGQSKTEPKNWGCCQLGWKQQYINLTQCIL